MLCCIVYTDNALLTTVTVHVLYTVYTDNAVLATVTVHVLYTVYINAVLYTALILMQVLDSIQGIQCAHTAYRQEAIAAWDGEKRVVSK